MAPCSVLLARFRKKGLLTRSIKYCGMDEKRLFEQSKNCGDTGMGMGP